MVSIKVIDTCLSSYYNTIIKEVNEMSLIKLRADEQLNEDIINRQNSYPTKEPTELPPKHQYFDGKKFTRDEHTGYYLGSSGKPRKRMHIYVWEYYNSKVPKGYEVHHRDGNKANNDISNLQLVKPQEHQEIHRKQLTEEEREWRRQNLARNARPKASEWHKSDEGREWHKHHYEKMKESFHQQVERVCANCGKTFIGHPTSKYCSNVCKSADRRKQGVDNVERVCVVCGKMFITNKYRNGQTCSRECRGKLKWRNQRESKEC